MRAGSSKGFELRKGAWTTQEDILLKNCIEKYGEGKWHLVPLKAGLNRCRKSCRLRWLNYLRPNIKRGEFNEDEVDLMFRLHKLLGNRWSLIAGRIPGRTANDVKNYWNTHVYSRSKKQKKESDEDKSLQHITLKIIRPQPLTFSKTLNCYMGDNPRIITHGCSNIIRSSDGAKNFNISSRLISSPTTLDDNIDEYLKEIFNDNEKEILSKNEWLFGGSSVEGEALNVAEQEHDGKGNCDFEMDEAIWNLIDSDQL